MIVGVFIKGYKTYKNTTFIPLIKSTNHKLSIFIGKNGAGKSSILEALDTVFNDREWNQNINSKKGESFICPVFLIPKRERINNRAIPYISEFFWSYEIPQHTGAATYEAWEDFIEFRKELKKEILPSDHHLLVIGIDEERNTSYTSTHEKFKNSLKPKSITYSDHDKALKYILDRYRYVYLPIHNSPTNLVELKAKELQALLDKNFIKEIEKILYKEEDNTSPIKNINDHLDKFISEINEKLKTINEDYQYKSSQNHKITAEDVTEVILTKYLSKRPLRKDDKTIESLSSGEQRMAIIDVAHAFLSKSTDTSKELVISIDEPEASLSPTNCLRQFKRIFQISNIFKKQVIISTHWYGLLMTPEEATLTHISRENDSDKPTSKSLNLSRIQEERKSFPDSFEMKSYFDLVSSILSVTKGENQNWVICEGHDDQNYLQKHLRESIQNLNILPVGGRGGVRKIYEYLRIAAEDKAERGLIKGKILCIIDSDPEIIEISPCSKEAKKSLKILRFQIMQNGFAELIEPTPSGHYTETELEDTLNPNDFYNAAKYVIRRTASDTVRNAFLACKLNPESTYAGINYDLKFLKPTTLEAHEAKDQIKDFLTLTETKAAISEIYNISNTTPAWVQTIKNFFTPTPTIAQPQTTPSRTENLEDCHQ